MDPLILLIVGAAGLVGCVILLVLGLNMLRDERATRDGQANPAGAPAEANAALQNTAAATPAPIVTSPLAASEAAPAPEPPRPASGNPFAGVTARFGGGGARSSTHEVLRVLRDNLTGRLSLELSGRRYASLDEVGEGEARQALLTTLSDLNAFVGGGQPLPAGLSPEAPADEPNKTVVAARAARPAEPAPAPAGEYRPLPPPTMNPFKQMQVLREMAKNPPPEPKGMMEQIDDVLQERIIGTPLIHRNLHVRSTARGDAQFEADGQTYPSVEAIPDVEVRDVIKAAIAEWETKK